jgi:N-acetylgalactosamine-6-sulfatase
MQYTIALLTALLLAPLAALHAADAPKQRPNVIFILADDSGFADFGCYGHPYARTPNIDSLARDGTRFTQFYATGVTCCPARTGLMTSRWPASFATYPANGGFGERVTITELLHKAGYATGHFGKWHIGPEEKAGVYGLDAVRSIDEAGKKMIETTRGRDARVYDEAIRFIEQRKAGPFYLNIWSHISHHKIAPPASYVDKFKDVVVDESKFAAPMRAKFAACKARGGDVSEHMRRYLADIHTMDEDIGRVLKRVDELGLRDNTVVVFSSDQGPAPLEASAMKDPEARKQKGRNSKPQSAESEHSRLDSMGYVAGLRGGKTGMYEGGVRVPWIVRWPARVPAGRVDEKSVLSGIDWLPTLCAITDVKISTGDFEGEDTSAAWFGGTHTRTRSLFWKPSSPGSSAGIREAQWKLIYPTRKNGGDLELYDITTDPAEVNNLAAQHPDVVQHLSTKVQAWVATLPKEYIKTNDVDK